jgi:UDP-N-acetylglucosamine diphosphorylase/glucosamine-1-phosphate N-acetyltransferase
MQIIFIDQPAARTRLYPLTYTRPISDLRIGILTLAEKWSKNLQITTHGFQTEEYLAGKYEPIEATSDTLWVINGIIPSPELTQQVTALKSGQVLVQDEKLLVAKGKANPFEEEYEQVSFTEQSADFITYTWDIFRLNGKELRADFKLLTQGRKSASIGDSHTIVYGKENVFLEEGATVKAAILNAENGPIYLGKDAEIQEGAMVRGPFALGEHSVVNMGAKIRGDSSTGPHCKIGGEVSNSVFWGYNSKAHDGFLGNAVIGQWCNLGADTNNSNLKNNYDPVRMWDYETESFIASGLQFCGLIMGDHSKTGINTMFNTGTVVGVAANIYGEGFPRTIIPSFAWGGAGGFLTHHPRKALITAKIVMARRNMEPTEPDKHILNHIFESTARFRAWEKK